jgi:hypothetical protein
MNLLINENLDNTHRFFTRVVYLIKKKLDMQII